MTTPLGRGSIALGLHLSPGNAREAVEKLCAQAVMAERHGFDGVAMSEHHGGFPTYLPVPTLVASRLLAVTDSIWAAPCPTILPLRHPVSVVEDLAWLAAAYPGRVGAGFVPGYQQRDYEIFGIPDRFPERLTEFAELLPWVAAGLRGAVKGPLQDDPAIAALADCPVPVVVGTGGRRGAARAARAGAGLLLTSTSDARDLRKLVDAHRAEGATAPNLLVRRVWLGDPPASMGDQLASYARADTSAVLPHRAVEEVVLHGDPETVAVRLAGDCEVAGADGLNLRVFAPDAPVGTLLDQIERIGSLVLPAVRRRRGWERE